MLFIKFAKRCTCTKSIHPKSKLCVEHRRGQLQLELESLQSREMQLSVVKEGLEEELKCSKSELEICQDQLEASQVELSKTKVYSHTLDKRNKVCGVQYVVYSTWYVHLYIGKEIRSHD